MLTSLQYTSLKLFLTLPLNVTHVIKRSVGENPLKKVVEKCVGGDKTSAGNDKPQFYKPFAQPLEVSPEKFTRNYEGDTFLQDPAIRKELSFYNSKASKQEPIPYKETGVTKEELEAMVAYQIIKDTEEAIKEAMKPSNFLEDEKKKKKLKLKLIRKNKKKNRKRKKQRLKQIQKVKINLLLMNSKFITKLLLTIIGAILFIAYMWHRFIRERLPKDIPFNLTEYGCIILMYICCIYIFIIIMLIVTFRTKNDMLSRIIDYIYKPLKVFDESVKDITLITYYHEKFMIAISTKDISYTKVYYLFNILPRLVLVSTLSIDTFYFHHLENLYKILLIGLLIFFYKYFIYSLKYAKELYIQKLEAITNKIQTNYNPNSEDTDDCFLYVREFVDVQTDSIFYNNRRYTIYPLPTVSYLNLFNQNTPVEQIQTEHFRLLDIIIPISVHLEEFDLRNNFNSKIKYIKIAIFSTYLICWTYILITSLHNLPHDAFSWLWIIQDIEEPFSLTNN